MLLELEQHLAGLKVPHLDQSIHATGHAQLLGAVRVSGEGGDGTLVGVCRREREGEREQRTTDEREETAGRQVDQ
jgi:hypothetical protein